MNIIPELVELDLEEEKENARTMREVSRMADSICPVLQTTFDCPGLQENGKMPLLNLQVWVDRVEREGGSKVWEVLWEYYRKPCSTRNGIATVLEATVPYLPRAEGFRPRRPPGT